MIFRDFFYPGLVAASLMFATALTVGLIWEVVGLFVFI